MSSLRKSEAKMPRKQAKRERKEKQQKSVNPVHHRCNFLLQAADLLSSASSTKKLAPKMGKLAKECQKKGLIKLHPYSKRTLCKNCHSPIFGFASENCAKIRYRRRRRKISHLVVTCSNCGFIKRFLISNRDYELWIEKNEKDEEVGEVEDEEVRDE